jgi:hypothetical protein
VTGPEDDATAYGRDQDREPPNTAVAPADPAPPEDAPRDADDPADVNPDTGVAYGGVGRAPDTGAL